MISKNGYDYKKVSKSKIPLWVHKKWEKIECESHPLDIDGKKFYFKGEKYRYAIKFIIYETPAQGVYKSKLEYYKRKRDKKHSEKEYSNDPWTNDYCRGKNV